MMKMARRIALLCGGASGEREVSLLSAAAVEEALEKRYEVIKIDTGVEGWAHTLLCRRRLHLPSRRGWGERVDPGVL